MIQHPLQNAKISQKDSEGVEIQVKTGNFLRKITLWPRGKYFFKPKWTFKVLLTENWTRPLILLVLQYAQVRKYSELLWCSSLKIFLFLPNQHLHDCDLPHTLVYHPEQCLSFPLLHHCREKGHSHCPGISWFLYDCTRDVRCFPYHSACGWRTLEPPW